MKIKTQVSISLIVFVIMAVVILFSYFSSNNQLHEIQKNQQIIDDIEKSSFELYYLENDYHNRGGTLRIERWNAKYAELTGQISALTLTDPSEQDVLKDLVKSHKELNTSFLNLVAVTGGLQGKEPTGTSQEIKELSAGTVAGQTQTLMSRALELSQMVRVKANEVEKRTTLIISSSIAVLMVFVLLNYLIINRSVLKSISTLHKGSERIGSGDLDTKIETLSHDELGDLSVAITEMASNLKTVLTSKSALEKEVAERKQAEDALKDSEQRLFEIISFLPDATFAINRKGIVISWNRAMVEMTGVPAAQILGKGNYEYSLPLYGEKRPILIDLVFSSIEEISKNYSSVNINGDVLTAEIANASLQGEKVILWVKAAPLYDREGNITGAIESIRDITGRKRAEEALHESEERYRNVVEVQTEFICRFLPDFTHIFVNDAYCRYFDKKREEFIGHRFRPVVHPEDREIVAQHLASLTPERPVRDIDQRIIMPDGSTRWQRWSDRAIFGKNDRVIEYQSVGRDITEKKEAEYALRQASRKLALLSSITRHDINNQLTVLMGYLTILQKKQPDPSFSEYFLKASTAAQRISAMIQFTREYESIGVKAPAWQDCRTLADTAAKQAPLGKIAVKNDLPAGTEIFADPLVVKVFYNLMDNAVRYGNKITTIRFSVDESGNDPVIVCEDDGDGVVAEEKEKIFERGFGKNTGLGLSLSREILDITGIIIRETGEPGKGARFEIVVPKGAWRITGKGA